MYCQNADLVWSCIAAIGSLLLATGRELKGKALAGVWLIFTAFVIHALCDSYSVWQCWGPIGVILFVVFALLLGLRKSIFKRRKIA
jgi:hypothetical protein